MWGVEAAAAVGCCGGSLFGWLRRRGRPPVGVCCCWGGFSVARVSVLLCAVLCWRWGASCELEAACWGGAGRSAAECWMGSHGEFPRCCSLLVARCPFLLWGSAQGGGRLYSGRVSSPWVWLWSAVCWLRSGGLPFAFCEDGSLLRQSGASASTRRIHPSQVRSKSSLSPGARSIAPPSYRLIRGTCSMVSSQ